MQIILASNNESKLREFKEILTPLGINVISQSEAGVDIEVEETGTTFAENAYLKARAIFDITGLPVIADDSGLEVDALNGEPGIYSARFAPSDKRCDVILERMKDVPDENRSADYVCCICYIDKHGVDALFEGKCYGSIGYEPCGKNGFGFDPIFQVNGKSYAELTPDEKNAVSHRGIAAEKLLEHLKINPNKLNLK